MKKTLENILTQSLTVKMDLLSWFEAFDMCRDKIFLGVNEPLVDDLIETKTTYIQYVYVAFL